MKRWKVWFEMNEVRFALEFQGEFNNVCTAAEQIATRMGVVFAYDIEVLK